MNVFILCTGRCGSVSFIKACGHITNYTSSHESLSRAPGINNRFNYPQNHIEGDNRLSWYLGTLEKKYGNNAFYVHLIRDEEKVVKSFTSRFNRRGSIVHTFSEGVKMLAPELLIDNEKSKISRELVQSITNNIQSFLLTKSNKITINIDFAENQFPEFWKKINAQGNLENAIKEFSIAHNNSKQNLKYNFRYEVKLFLYRIKNIFIS